MQTLEDLGHGICGLCTTHHEHWFARDKLPPKFRSAKCGVVGMHHYHLLARYFYIYH